MCVNGYNTYNNPRTFDVPQGTVLVPLLFPLYTLIYPKWQGEFHIFADDSNIYFCFKDLNVLERLLNSDLKLVADWLRSNLYH